MNTCKSENMVPVRIALIAMFFVAVAGVVYGFTAGWARFGAINQGCAELECKTSPEPIATAPNPSIQPDLSPTSAQQAEILHIATESDWQPLTPYQAEVLHIIEDVYQMQEAREHDERVWHARGQGDSWCERCAPQRPIAEGKP